MRTTPRIKAQFQDRIGPSRCARQFAAPSVPEHRPYDFAVVQIVERQQVAKPSQERVPPTIHASYWPTFDLRAGQPVTFFVRTCRTTFGQETWDFGDGSAPVTVKSDGCAVEKAKEGYARTEHIFLKPGDYLVKVARANERGEIATARLWVPVGKSRAAALRVIFLETRPRRKQTVLGLCAPAQPGTAIQTPCLNRGNRIK